MRWLVAFLCLLLLAPVAAQDSQSLLRTVDMMKPMMRNADSFSTAQRMVRNDLEAFLKRPNNATYTRLNSSLERLGDIAGYTDPYVCKSKVRSVKSYRSIRQHVDAVAIKQPKAFYCTPRRS